MEKNNFFFPVRLLSAIPLLKRELLAHPDKDNISIAFPDEGAWKRFHFDFTSHWSTITCTKVRKGELREVSIKEGGRDIKKACCYFIRESGVE